MRKEIQHDSSNDESFFCFLVDLCAKNIIDNAFLICYNLSGKVFTYYQNILLESGGLFE